MKITVIGTGYVGLVSGTCFAEIGHEVVCVDNNSKKIEDLENGIIPIFEPGLDQLIIKNQKINSLSFTTDIKEAVKDASAVFIAVGTPPTEEGGADLTYVYNVAKELASIIDEKTCIVTKSTVPVGTNDEVKKIIEDNNPTLEFYVASNPEFLREGCAIDDFLNPDRVLVGTNSSKARSIMEKIYRPMSDKNILVLFTDIRTAELTKYAANAFLATKISFINEIADICEKVDASIEHLSRGIGVDHRIGKEYLKPGPGFGGSCFPKDTKALLKISKDSEATSQIISTVIKSNDERKINLSKKIEGACSNDVKGKTIAILGLAFKANTDDMRDSPALSIIPDLINKGAKIKAYDPEAIEQAKQHFQNIDIDYFDNLNDTISKADAVVILTEWEEFKDLDFENFKSLIKKPYILVDFRNLFTRLQMENLGINYYSVGRKALKLQ